MDQSAATDAVARNTTARAQAPRREPALLAGQKRVLELIAAGAPLDATLTALIHFIEAREAGLVCGILLVAPDGKRFHRGYGPALPEIYHRTLNGAPITPPYLDACGKAAHSGQPVLVSDIAGDNRWPAAWRDLMLSCGLKAAYSIPVHASDNRVVASFAMYYDRPQPSDAPRPELAGIAGHLAGLALERHRFEAALRDGEERLAAELANAQRLQRVSTLLIQEDDIDALYRQILDAAVAIMHSDMASLQMLDRDRGALRLLASKGFHPASAEFWAWVERGSGSPCGTALAGGERIVVEDVEACDFVSGTPHMDEYRRSHIRAVQSTPLISRSGRTLGMISTHWREPHRPDERDLRLLDVLARQAADLIERKRNEESLQAQARRLKSLNHVARSMSTDLDLERIIQTVTDSATELSGARFGAFFYNVADESGERYMLFTLSGASREAFAKFDMPRNTSMFGATFRGEGIVRCDDVRTDPRYGRNVPHHGLPEGHPPVASYLAVPVVLRSGEVIGGLFFGHERPGVFTRETEDVVAGIAAHAALAIDNARLFETAQTEIERSRRVERAAQQLAAIVESSEDAIVSKDMNGTILTWNRSAERLFGYTADEAIGRLINILIPPGHDNEEPEILARIRQGKSIEHYDTVRRHKNGTLLDISLTVSPIRDSAGNIIGASKIARDISERRAAEVHRELLLHELSHRVKNTLATVQSIAQQTLRQTPEPETFQPRFVARLAALAHTHDLLMRTNWHGAALNDLVAIELHPYGGAASGRWTAAGPHVTLNAKSALALGMAFHELATNAAKHGALSVPEGRVEVSWQIAPGGGGLELLRFSWLERNGPRVAEPASRGFGSRLIENGLAFELDAAVTLAFEPAGVCCTIDLPLDAAAGEEQQ